MLQECDESFVIQPQYKRIPGHPVFFGHLDRNLFLQLKGDRGAKEIMNKFSHRKLISVDDAGILLDIDNQEDYKKMESFLQ